MAALAAVVAALALGCADAPIADEPSAPPPFQGLSRVLLVRSRDWGGARPKDALDAVAETLAARGRTARTVDLGPGAGGGLAVTALYREIEARVAGSPPGDPRSRGVVRLGARAVDALRTERVDGAVLYLRFSSRLLAPAPMPPGPLAHDPVLVPAATPPAGALALVDRDGNLVWFGWGSAEPASASAGTPAEAVDVLLRVIDGVPLSDALDG